ncbi:MAG TPA: CinA family nicotinamide mononucleotide deamidase-related protein [Longimicrobiales bacterium]|nr:CinA family nicotinamide mononucleotide deamidase-related protein [Longimicrobiales bacterium]
MSREAPAGPLRSVVVAVGDELLLGRTVDTNGAWLGRELAELGVPVLRKATVGDADGAIRRALAAALDDARVVLFSGGLGPTEDDRTRTAVAAELGLALEADEAVLEALTARYLARGWDHLPPANRRQALVPAGARVLANPVGTAPGLVMEHRGRLVALLPGVPRELKALFPQVAEAIRAAFGEQLRPVHLLTVHTTGIPESVLAPLVEEAMAGAPAGVEVAYLPDLTGVDIRLTVRDRSGADAREALEAARALLDPVVEDYRVPGESGDVAEAVLDALRARGWTLALGESCTGGLAAKRLTDVPGSSAVVAGGVVAYSNEAKTALLGVSAETIREHGAVSEPVARALAQGAARAFGARCGVGITGVAGPGGGSPEKPVGTVHYAATVGDRTRAAHTVFAGDREAVRIRAAQAALTLLLRMVEDGS